MNKPIDIHRLIEEERLEIHFQPITSMRRQDIIGLEALCRARDENGQPISPLSLFAQAHEQGKTIELDRACSRVAAQNFAPFYARNPFLILFLNFHPDTVNAELQGSNAFLKTVEQLRIAPQNIALEILEAEVTDGAALSHMVDSYKGEGFLVALDDLGAGHSNLDRISAIKPDILKIDRALIQSIHSDYHKQEVFKSLVQLSEKIGGWTIAEGIEVEDEAIEVLELGADMVQGYYFARPQLLKKSDDDSEISDLLGQEFCQNIHETALQYRNRKLENIQHERKLDKQRGEIACAFGDALEGHSVAEFDAILKDTIAQQPKVESVHILDRDGIQVSTCISNLLHVQKQKTAIFHLPAKGTDHSLKEYFYMLVDTPAKIYSTVPYVPRPSGNLCVTVSTLFADETGADYVVCVAIRL